MKHLTAHFNPRSAKPDSPGRNEKGDWFGTFRDGPPDGAGAGLRTD
jgi:hypothetical protein